MSNAAKIFLTLFLTYAFFTNSYLTTNDASRFSMTAAIVENGSLEITEFLKQVLPCSLNQTACWQPKDFVKIGGRIYSDKAPLGSFLAVPVYYVITKFTNRLPLIVYFISLFTAGLLTALTGVLLYRIGSLFGAKETMSVAVALAYGLCSMAVFYGGVFFSGGITAFFTFAAFYLLAIGNDSRFGRFATPLAGTCMALAIMSDYYAGICSVVLLVYSGWSKAGAHGAADLKLGARPHSSAVSFSIRKFALAALPFAAVILLLMIYNYHVFGSPFETGYKFSYLSKSLHSKGFYGITLPTAAGLLQLGKLLFSMKFDMSNLHWGLFFTSMPIAFSIVFFNRFVVYRRKAVAIAVMFAGFLYMNMSVGWFDAYSARFFMPVLPFLFLPLFTLQMDDRIIRNIFFFVVGLSFSINLLGNDMYLMKDPAPYISGYHYLYRPGMQNLVGEWLAARGLRTGYFTFLPLFIVYMVVWLIPPRWKLRGIPPGAGRPSRHA